jgi:hypothetical protein
MSDEGPVEVIVVARSEGNEEFFRGNLWFKSRIDHTSDVAYGSPS